MNTQSLKQQSTGQTRNLLSAGFWSKLILRAVRQIRIHREIARQRRELAQLSDAQLKDIGISRVDALQEAERSFWDVSDAARKQNRL
ncbi:hypothetical protein OLMES_5471 [Oleiphilus messinensis]|uniref:YjiS-like domain-containing protein n=1 Tax=Oleiphilus messinensis TaxID=141451 RepID=A0A1Y0IG49_9GAMM|nr:DUF1127 domain-containing protein [Oleiphilus messinensis]ARU59451.1 hypothetical protein OLMES_5471 [Oleiphilus messinensis]